MWYSISLVLIYLITGSLYPLTTFLQFSHPPHPIPQDLVFLENKPKRLLSRLVCVRLRQGLGAAIEQSRLRLLVPSGFCELLTVVMGDHQVVNLP